MRILEFITDITLIMASIMAIGLIAIMDICLTGVSAGVGGITEVVIEEALVGAGIMDGEVDMAGAVEADITGEGMAAIETDFFWDALLHCIISRSMLLTVLLCPFLHAVPLMFKMTNNFILKQVLTQR